MNSDSDSDNSFILDFNNENDNTNNNDNNNNNNNIIVQSGNKNKKMIKMATDFFVQKESRTILKCINMAKKKMAKMNKTKKYQAKKINCWYCHGTKCCKCNFTGFFWRMMPK
jgi:hypothetical protein